MQSCEYYPVQVHQYYIEPQTLVFCIFSFTRYEVLAEGTFEQLGTFDQLFKYSSLIVNLICPLEKIATKCLNSDAFVSQ